jgi:DNA primase
MFPMNDSGGRVVAFSGRLLGKNDKAPKYVNSPETELYKKSELLFGYDKAKQGIRQLDFSLIVEGQFDVVMAHQAGYINTVAVSGTALTTNHVQLLERLSDRVVLALDADRAGISAVKRAADLMLRRGLDVKVAEVPDGQDPADLVREDKTKLKAVVGKAVHVIEFLLHQLQHTEHDARALKLKVREEVLPYIILLPNRIDQEHFVGVVAKTIGTSADSIRFELERLRESAKGEVFVSDHTLEERIEAQSGDLVQKTYTFLCAAGDLLETDQKEWFTVELDKLSRLTDLGSPDTTAVAETTFILERQFEKMSKHGVFEQIISALNQLRVAIAKREIGNLREQMRDMSSDEQLHALKQITNWEKVLRTEPLHYPVLTDKKD